MINKDYIDKVILDCLLTLNKRGEGSNTLRKGKDDFQNKTVGNKSIKAFIEEKYYEYAEEFLEGIGDIFRIYVMLNVSGSLRDKLPKLPTYKQLEQEFIQYFIGKEEYNTHLVVIKTLSKTETPYGNALEILSSARIYYEYEVRLINEYTTELDVLKENKVKFVKDIIKCYVHGSIDESNKNKLIDEFGKDIINKYVEMIENSEYYKRYHSLVLSGLNEISDYPCVIDEVKELKDKTLLELVFDEYEFELMLGKLRWDYMNIAASKNDFKELARFSLYKFFVDSNFYMPAILLDLPVIEESKIV